LESAKLKILKMRDYTVPSDIASVVPYKEQGASDEASKNLVQIE